MGESLNMLPASGTMARWAIGLFGVSLGLGTAVTSCIWHVLRYRYHLLVREKGWEDPLSEASRTLTG